MSLQTADVKGISGCSRASVDDSVQMPRRISDDMCHSARNGHNCHCAPFICHSLRRIRAPFRDEEGGELLFWIASIGHARACENISQQSLPVKVFISVLLDVYPAALIRRKEGRGEGQISRERLVSARSRKFHKAASALLPSIYGNPRLMPRDLKLCRISRSVPAERGAIKAFASWRARFRAANLTNVS